MVREKKREKKKGASCWLKVTSRSLHGCCITVCRTRTRSESKEGCEEDLVRPVEFMWKKGVCSDLASRGDILSLFFLRATGEDRNHCRLVTWWIQTPWWCVVGWWAEKKEACCRERGWGGPSSSDVVLAMPHAVDPLTRCCQLSFT